MRNIIKSALRKLATAEQNKQVITLDYPVVSKQRWTVEQPHEQLYAIINASRAVYDENLEFFLTLTDNYLKIAEDADTANPHQPNWVNGWMPALDGVALYGFLVKYKPKLFIEVGSGNSTKFARRAISDHDINTKIISIDPCPRAEIDKICDEVIRQPVEDVDLSIFDQLESGDMLFIDNSHRSFMNSDATTVFLDVIPRLKPGVIVQIHDIFLPFDYPVEWAERYYSEQYLLATSLLAKGSTSSIILPNMFICHDNILNKILMPLWSNDKIRNAEKHGVSFWLVTN